MFPIKLAAADIGSNAMRFLAVEFANAHDWRILQQTRVPIRLGHDVFLTGGISDELREQTVEALATFAEMLRRHHVAAHRAVATSALRDSSNGAAVRAEVRERTGIEIELISGTEEARLVYVAIRNRVQLGPEPWLLADLGGGSLELSLADDRAIRETVSLAMGAVRLMEENGRDADLPMYEAAIARRRATLLQSPALQTRTAGMVATGGSADAIARIVHAAPDGNGVSRLDRNALREAVQRIAETPLAGRAARWQLQADRADVILPAALVYQYVAELAGAEQVVVPNVGVKEGVVIDLLSRTH